jgi:membrane protease YdiL (CAAX protease family)
MTAESRRAKSAAIAFTGVTCLLSWSYLWALRAGLRVPPGLLPFVLMWIPGAVAIAFRLGSAEGFSSAGFRAGPVRFWVLAYAVPFGLATATYATAWMLQQVHVTPYLKQQSMLGPLPFRLSWFNAEATTAGLLAQRFLVVATVSIVIGFVGALGEEIGWRGYLLPKLLQARVRFPILIVGLIWAAWHVPFVLLNFQNEPYLSAALYALACVVVGVFISWLRLASGSVWVAAMAHTSYNSFYQDFYDHSFVGQNKWLWAGEVGLLCSAAFAGVAVVLYCTNRIAPLIQQARVPGPLEVVS